MSPRTKTTIKQGALTDVMTHLSELPEREKDPNNRVNLSEVFRAKEYVAEIKRALKRGYSFDDLANIFTERCGVTITARQMKYHYTREKNLREKGKKNHDKPVRIDTERS